MARDTGGKLARLSALAGRLAGSPENDETRDEVEVEGEEVEAADDEE